MGKTIMLEIKENSTEAEIVEQISVLNNEMIKCALMFMTNAQTDLSRGSLTPMQRDLLIFANDSLRLTIYGLIKTLYGESVLDLTKNLINSGN
jgi:hypothetical protein